MLMRTDPFRDFERFTEGLLNRQTGTWMPMDAYRHGDVFTVHVDMPGVDPDSIDLTVEQNELTVAAEPQRTVQEGAQWLIRERPTGRYVRRLFVGDNLDTDHIDAEYTHGVLVLRLPLRESAKPRRVEVRASDTQRAVEAGSSA